MKPGVLLSIFVFSFSQTVDFKPSIQFESLVQNKGSIAEGSKCVFKFPFQNVGSSPLTIAVKSSCGCLVPWWNKEPVLPGEWDTVYAQYDTRRLGKFQKTLTVVSNDSESANTILHVKGEVIPREVQGLLIFTNEDILPTIPNRQNHIFLDAENLPEKMRFWNYSEAPIDLNIVESASGFKKHVELDPKAFFELRFSEKHFEFVHDDFNVLINKTTILHFIKKISK